LSSGSLCWTSDLVDNTLHFQNLEFLCKKKQADKRKLASNRKQKRGSFRAAGYQYQRRQAHPEGQNPLALWLDITYRVKQHQEHSKTATTKGKLSKGKKKSYQQQAKRDSSGNPSLIGFSVWKVRRLGSSFLLQRSTTQGKWAQSHSRKDTNKTYLLVFFYIRRVNGDFQRRQVRNDKNLNRRKQFRQ
jgi:hypothetical protein